jgi:hypothetical protein
MKQIKGVVELHGEYIEIREGNNETSAYIEGVSPYDFEAIILAQSITWKKDLLKDLSNDLGITIYTIKDMEKVWEASAIHLGEMEKVSSGLLTLDNAISLNKEGYFKGKK